MKSLLLGIAGCLCLSTGAQAATMYGVASGNNLVSFDSSMPSTFTSSQFITGVSTTFVGLDFRNDNVLFGLGADFNLYQIDTSTAAATLVGGLSEIVPGRSFAFDFNPVLAGGTFARIISNTDDNRVIGSLDGQYLAPIEKTDVFFATGDVNYGSDPTITGIAYTNNFVGATSTQQFGIDAENNVLVTVANNAGTLVTVGSLGIDVGEDADFEINGFDGNAYLSSGGNFYTVDLTSGAATLVGSLESPLTVLTSAAVPETSTWLMMIVGFGAVGGALRRKQNVTVRYA